MTLTPTADALLPAPAILKRLAVSESGFVFDPSSGQSFSVNETGLHILRLAQKDNDFDSLIAQLTQEFAAENNEIKRDVQDFAARLKGYLK